jgi:hypothetical protein
MMGGQDHREYRCQGRQRSVHQPARRGLDPLKDAELAEQAALANGATLTLTSALLPR